MVNKEHNFFDVISYTNASYDIPLGASSHPVPVRCGDGFCIMRHRLTWDNEVIDEDTTTACEQFCV